MKFEPTKMVGGSPVMQRLQIGVLGLFAVLLMVGMADMLLEGASNEIPIDATATVEPGQVPEAQANGLDTVPAASPTEPLVDLGVVPDLPAENAAPDAQIVAPKPGQVVPDLPANPDRKRN